MGTTAKIQDAKEVAAFVSKGLQPKEVAQKVDLPLTYVLELTELPEFLDALEHLGGATAVSRWQEYQLDRSVSVTLRAKVRARMTEYFTILDDIAMNAQTKPETRFAVIKELFVQGKLSEDEVVSPEAVFPPSFFTAIVAASREDDKWQAKRVQ